MSPLFPADSPEEPDLGSLVDNPETIDKIPLADAPARISRHFLRENVPTFIRWKRIFESRLHSFGKKTPPSAYLPAEQIPIHMAFDVVHDAFGRSIRIEKEIRNELTQIIRTLISPSPRDVERLHRELKSRTEDSKTASHLFTIPNYEVIAQELCEKFLRMTQETGDVSIHNILECFRAKLSRYQTGIAMHPRTQDSASQESEKITPVDLQFSGKAHLLKQLYEKLGVEDFPSYLTSLIKSIVHDKVINTQEKWGLSDPAYQVIAHKADQFAQLLFSRRLHPDVDGNHDSKALQAIMCKAKMFTPDDFDRVRSANAKLRIMYFIFSIQAKLDFERTKLVSQQLEQHFMRFCKKNADGTWILNVPITETQKEQCEIDGLSIEVQGVEFADPKTFFATLRKAMSKGEQEMKNIRDQIRLAIKISAKDSRTIEQILHSTSRIMALVMGFFGTSTIHSDKEHLVTCINLIPLQEGDEKLLLADFNEKMRRRGILSTGGRRGYSSLAHRGTHFTFDCPVFESKTNGHDEYGYPKSEPISIEGQILLDTPEDHPDYEHKQMQRISEACGFLKWSQGKSQPATFDDFIQDLIQGLLLHKGSLQTGCQKGTSEKESRPLNEIALITILKSITHQKDGVLSNLPLIQAIRRKPKFKTALIEALEKLKEYKPHHSEYPARRRRVIEKRERLGKPISEFKSLGPSWFEVLRQEAIFILTKGSVPPPRRTFDEKDGIVEVYNPYLSTTPIQRIQPDGTITFYDPDGGPARRNFHPGRPFHLSDPYQTEAIQRKHLDVCEVSLQDADGQTLGYLEIDRKTGDERFFRCYDVERAKGHQIQRISYSNPKQHKGVAQSHFTWSRPEKSPPTTPLKLFSQVDYLLLPSAPDQEKKIDHDHCNVYVARDYFGIRIMRLVEMRRVDAETQTAKTLRFQEGFKRPIEKEKPLKKH